MSNITDQLADKAALQATLNAAGQDNEQAIAREQAARQACDRLNAQLSEIRARIERDRRSHGAEDDEDLAEREAELARDLAAAEQAMEDAATQAAAARATIKAVMSDWLNPITITKSSIQEHLAAIASAEIEIERIDSAGAAVKEASAARQAARAAEGARYQEGLSRFLASQALGEIPQDAAFEPPPAAPDDGTQAADSATLAGLAVRRGEALAALATLQAALPAIRAAVLHQDLEAVLREHAGVATKEQKLRTRANAVRTLIDPYKGVLKPDFVPAPLAQPPAAGVNAERERLAGTWPALWAPSPH